MASRTRQLAASAAAVVVAVAGITVGFAATARADTEISCRGNAPMTPEPECTVNVTLTGVTWVNLQITWAPQASWITGGAGWSGSCVQGGQKAAISQKGANGTSPFTVGVPLPFAGSATCTLSVTAGVGGSSQDTLQPNFVVLNVFTDGQQNTSSPPPASSGHPVRGYDGKCLDDTGNKAADRTKIQIWACGKASASQQWTYRKGELVHKAMCVNAKGAAKNGALVILWSCTGSANEIWTHKTNGEYVLKAGGGKLCLTDPGRSTRNGTQLVVRTCANAADQHWTVP